MVSSRPNNRDREQLGFERSVAKRSEMMLSLDASPSALCQDGNRVPVEDKQSIQNLNQRSLNVIVRCPRHEPS